MHLLWLDRLTGLDAHRAGLFSASGSSRTHGNLSSIPLSGSSICPSRPGLADTLLLVKIFLHRRGHLRGRITFNAGQFALGKRDFRLRKVPATRRGTATISQSFLRCRPKATIESGLCPTTSNGIY